MVKSMFSGVAGLRAHQTKMDVIGNNIANVNTNGFKTGRVTFKDSFYQTMAGSSSSNGSMGGTNAKQVGYGSQVGSIDVIHTPGGFAPTGESGDLMIDGNGFFCVGPYDKNGLNPLDKNSVPKLQLTRVGIFRFDGSGKLADPTGNVVYGFQGISAGAAAGSLDTNKIYTTVEGYNLQFENVGATPPVIALMDASGQKIRNLDNTEKPTIDEVVKPNDAGVLSLVTGVVDKSRLIPIELPYDATKNAPLKMKSVNIGASGIITGTDEYGNAMTLGQIAIANVPNPAALEMIDSSYYAVKNNTGDVLATAPGSGGAGSIKSGGLESSNVDLSKEFSDMITTQRGFQANTRIITVTDEMLQELVNLKR